MRRRLLALGCLVGAVTAFEPARDEGVVGVVGLDGFDGFDGFDGLDGFDGMNGLDGLVGFVGFVGFVGLDGFDGFVGAGPRAGTDLVAAQGGPLRIERRLGRGTHAGWRTLVDRDTGVVVRMWGRHASAPGAQGDAAVAARAARAFVAAHLDVLAPGARGDDFVVVDNRVDDRVDDRVDSRVDDRVDDRRRTVVLAQTYRGVRVVDAAIVVTFLRDRIYLVASEAMPHVRVPGAADVRGASAILPLVRAGGIEYRAVTVRRTGDADVYVGLDGREVARRGRLAPLATSLRYDVPVRHPAGERALRGAPRADILVDGAPRTTDLAGTFDAAAGAHVVTTSVGGPDVRVLDQSGNPARAELAVDGGGAVAWSLAGDPLGDAQLSAFVHASIGKARARELAPGLPWLATTLDVYVNQTGFPCNAFAAGDRLHFYLPDETCENTARLADVVYHELAHALHEHLLLAGVPSPLASLKEGIADYFAMTITDDPAVGRGYYKNDVAVREHDPVGFEKRYPEDIDLGSPHTTGLIIGGALWDLRTQLVAALGEPEARAVSDRIFVGILQRARDIPTAYVEALAADDDDGDLGNGTPHACAIEDAFGRHGLADDAYRPVALETPTLEGATVSAVAVASSGSRFGCGAVAIDRATLAWRVEGSDVVEQIAMTRDGVRWRGTLPIDTLPRGTVIRYRVVAEAPDGAAIAYPQNAADPEYQLFVDIGSEATALWCEPMDADPGWRATGSEQWEWAMPPATVAAGDPQRPYTGLGVLGTKVRGNPEYLDGSDSRIESAAIDATAYARVHVQFRRHLAVEDGAFDQASVDVGGSVLWQNLATLPGTTNHVDREWRFVDLDISAHAAEAPIAIGWRITADASRELGGWSIDDVCVVGLDKRAVCGDAIVDEGEDCDDGNAAAGDGCTPRCELDDVLEVGCCSTSREPRGASGLAVAVAMAFAFGYRRRRASSCVPSRSVSLRMPK